MSGHNILRELAQGNWKIPDPGTAKALPNDRTGIVDIVTGASGETNTLAAPVRPGVLLGLNMLTDGGGNRVITVASAIDALGTTTITLDDAGDFVFLMSRKYGSAYRWCLLGSSSLGELLGLTATAAELNALDGILATVTELNRAADMSTRVVNCTASTLAVTEAEHDGKIIVLDRAAGIAVTLPVPVAGMRFEFLVKTSFAAAATIKSVAGTQIMIGHALMGNDSDNTVVLWQATASDTFDTIDLFGTANSTGGLAGQRIVITGLSSTLWHVEITGDAAGTEASPFSDTVT